MQEIFIGILLLGLLTVVYFYHSKPSPTYHDKDTPAYTEDELIPDTWGVPKTQRHYRDLRGPVPHVNCRRDNGNCRFI